MHKKKEDTKAVSDLESSDIREENILEKCTTNVYNTLYSASDIYKNIIEGVERADRKKLKEVKKEVIVFNHQAKVLKDNVYKVLKQLRKDSVSQSHHYAQVLDYLREVAHCFTYISKPAYEYFGNNHSPLIPVQISELKHVSAKLNEFTAFVLNLIETNNFSMVDEVLEQQIELMTLIESYRKTQMKRLKHEEVGSKNTMLFTGILHETKNLLLHITNLVKAQRDFVQNADQ